MEAFSGMYFLYTGSLPAYARGKVAEQQACRKGEGIVLHVVCV